MNFSNLLSAAISGDVVFIIVVAVVFLLFIFVLPMFTNKRRQKQVEKMQETVVVGAEIKTVGGIIGTIIEVRDKSPVDKEIVIETGVGSNKSTLVLDMQAVYQVLHTVAPMPTSANGELAEVFDSGTPERNESASANESVTPVNPVESAVEEKPVQPEPMAQPVEHEETEQPAEPAIQSETEEAKASAVDEKAAITPSANSSKKTSTKKSSSSASNKSTASKK